MLPEAPLESTAYMIAGYSIFFGILLIYLFSLFLRIRNLKRDLNNLEEIQKSPLGKRQGKV